MKAILTKDQLLRLECEVDVINRRIDLINYADEMPCRSEVLASFDDRLNQINKILEKSYQLALRKEGK